MYVETSPSPDTRLRLGADMEGKLADIDLGPEGDASSPFGTPISPDSFVPDFGGGLDFETGPEDFVRGSPLAQVEERDAGGVYAELALLPTDAVRAGDRRARGHVARRRADGALPPTRACSALASAPRLSFHAGVGSAHQAAVSPLPIPG